MPLLSPSPRDPSNPLAGLGFIHIALPLIQHFLLLPTALGFGIGALLGQPVIGLAIGLAIGLLYAGFATVILRRALTEGFKAPAPPGDWRKWDHDDDWDT
jgi:hypothetical protein